MATELSRPIVELSVSDILNALELDHTDGAGKPVEYLAVPGNWGPRWLIPAESHAAASALSAWRPYTIPSRVKWLSIRAAARMDLLRFIPSVSGVTASRQGIARWFDLCGIRSQAGKMVILAGNPSPDRKLIAFLLDEAHRIAAVLKVALTAGGGLSLLHEAEVLTRLERYCWAPELISVHPEFRAAAQRFVAGPMPDRRFRPEYLDLLCTLPRTGACKRIFDVASELEKQLAPFRDLLDKTAPGLLDRSLACLNSGITLPTVLVHGDFVPWNIRNNPATGPVLVDWEWADFAGLPAYDLLHFHFVNDRLFPGKAGGYQAIRTSPTCNEYMRRMDLNPELLPQLTIAYLLDALRIESNHWGSEYTEYTEFLLRQLASVTGL